MHEPIGPKWIDANQLLPTKVTLVPLGGFATNAVSVGMVKLPQHPAYTDPALLSSVYRKAVLASTQKEKDPLYQVKGDTAKAVRALYRLSELESPPLRLVLGKDCLDICFLIINSKCWRDINTG